MGDQAREKNQIRFETELEFVQALANPFYLNTLGQQGYFEDAAFVKYLDYLQYWRKPQYARFIQYPQCLHHLGLVQHSQFREAIKLHHVAQQLASKQLAHWATWREPLLLSPNVNGTSALTNDNHNNDEQDVKMHFID